MRSRFARALLIVVAFAAAGACKKASGPTPDCNNHLRDGNETDVDCGGPMCDPCGTDKLCRVDKDCISKLCNSDGRCSAPGCSDGIKNGSESDVDCGGPDCKPCGQGQLCYGGNDCQSSLCDSDGGVCR